MNVKQRVVNGSRWLYARATPKTRSRAILAIPLLIATSFYLAVWSISVAYGAGTALDGGTLALGDLYAIPEQVWSSYTGRSALLQALYGPFHWLTVLAVPVGVVGARMGFVLPELAYVVQYSDIVVVAIGTFMFLQIAYLAEPALQKIRAVVS